MSQYVPASWNTGLYLNDLQKQIDDIEAQLGLFKLVSTSTPPLTITNVDNQQYTVSSTTNNTSWGFSTTTLNDVWQIDFKVADNSSNNMYVGISQDLTQNFPGASFPSMKMCDYGMIIDYNNGSDNLLTIQNGVFSSTAYKLADATNAYKITYDGTTLKYYVDNINVINYTVSLNPIYLVCGSISGGTITNIQFKGAGGGGGGSQGLASVLSVSNDAGNQDILNVKDIFVNNYVNIGNAVGNTSQIHLCFDSGNTTTGYNWQMVASDTTTPQIDYQLYNNNALVGSAMTVRQLYTTFNENVISNTGAFYTANGDAVVFDSAVNFPTMIFNSNTSIQTKTIQNGAPTSVLQWKPSNFNEFLNSFTMFIPSLEITYNNLSSTLPLDITFRFYLTTVKDAPFDNTNPLNISFLSAEFGSENNIFTQTATKVILSTYDANNANSPNGIYLTIVSTSSQDPSPSYLDLNFSSQLTATYNNTQTVVPVTLT